MCCGFLQHSTVVVDKAVAMSTKVDVLSGYFRMRLKREKNLGSSEYKTADCRRN